MKKEDIKSLPNQLTFLRVLSIPILWLFALLQFKVAFVIVFAFAALTDILDGYLARRLKKESDFGAWFDSLADNIIAASLIFWIWLLLPELLSLPHEQLLPLLVGLPTMGRKSNIDNTVVVLPVVKIGF